MKISNFKYILTNIGGGWGTIYQLYGVTPDGDVYSTKKFDYRNLNLDTDIECKLLGHLDKVELGLKEESELHYAVMDASDLTVYEVEDTLKVLHVAPEITENNPKLYEDIQRLVLAYSEKETQESLSNYNGDFIIGEVKTAEEFRQAMSLMKGHPVHTTFHGTYNTELIEKLRAQLK